MLSYEPDNTIAHRLDPRSKIAVQMGFAATALAHTSPRALIVLTGVAIVALVGARVSLVVALYAYRLPLVILLVAILVSTVTFEPPWIDLEAGYNSARASYRVALILLVSAAYVRSTSARESRAAVGHTIPGKPGQLLGMGVAIVFRFLPVLQKDLRTIRDAQNARLGSERGLFDRARRLGLGGLSRAFLRADRLSLALEARCFSWNPTLPRLSLTRLDVPVIALAIVLFASVAW